MTFRVSREVESLWPRFVFETQLCIVPTLTRISFTYKWPSTNLRKLWFFKAINCEMPYCSALACQKGSRPTTLIQILALLPQIPCTSMISGSIFEIRSISCKIKRAWSQVSLCWSLRTFRLTLVLTSDVPFIRSIIISTVFYSWLIDSNWLKEYVIRETIDGIRWLGPHLNQSQRSVVFTDQNIVSSPWHKLDVLQTLHS